MSTLFSASSKEMCQSLLKMTKVSSTYLAKLLDDGRSMLFFIISRVLILRVYQRLLNPLTNYRANFSRALTKSNIRLALCYLLVSHLHPGTAGFVC